MAADGLVRRLAPALLLALAAGAAQAQGAGAAAVPETNQIIEALRPSPNRSRNLLIRRTQPESEVPPSSAPAPASPVTGATPAPTAAEPPAASPATAPAAPAPAPTPAPVAAAPAEAPPSLSLAIQFELNSARVRPESGPVLGNLVAAMLSPDLKANRFVIEGHTDARGQAAANLLLSQQRAEEVRLYLVALGVHPARLKAVGKGASDPANPKDPLSPANRRVRVVTIE